MPHPSPLALRLGRRTMPPRALQGEKLALKERLFLLLNEPSSSWVAESYAVLMWGVLLASAVATTIETEQNSRNWGPDPWRNLVSHRAQLPAPGSPLPAPSHAGGGSSSRGSLRPFRSWRGRT